MRTLYFDCFAGASGNMILGGIIALGVDKNELVAQLKHLKISDFELEVSSVDRSGIAATHLEVKVPPEHVHRHLRDIEKIICDSELPKSVQQKAVSIFTRLAEAEAKVHGIDLDAVHFHEVGATDAIIDIVGSCIGFEKLGIERFACSKIHTGSGFVQMAHGKYPVPPPAVTELLKGIPVYSTEIVGELITPTGAAIISTLCDSYGTIPDISVEQLAYAAGTREYEKFPNVLRLMIGETQDAAQTAADSLILIETNIDDLSPQILGFVMERSFELGAVDCWFMPIQMKKNRPATMLSILCDPKKKEVLSEMIFSETTTLGIRVRDIERNSLAREMVKVQTEFGEVDVKVGRYGNKVMNVMPEFEQVKKLALENNVAFQIISDAVRAKFHIISLSAKS